MKKRFVFACLLWACSRNEQPRQGSPPPALTAAAPAGSERASATSSAGLSAAPVATSALAAPAVARGSKQTIATSGYSTGLRLEGNLLTFCDDRGGRALDLASGVESARERACPKMPEERNRACGGIEFVAAVREPGQDDIIDVKHGPSIPTHGHINDCVYDSGALVTATWDEVVSIDIKTRERNVKAKPGADQLAIDDSWLAWSGVKQIFAEHR